MNLNCKIIFIFIFSFTIIYLLYISQVHLDFCKAVQEDIDPVEKRLANAKEIWDRAVAKRDDYESKKIFKVDDPWEQRRDVFFWDFFYPSFNCPHMLERIGKVSSGGKWICGFQHLEKNCKQKPVIVYSFGVNGEVTFEEEILKRTNFIIYMYDHTIDILATYSYLQKKYPGRVFLERLGISAKTDSSNLKTLSSHMKKNGHNFIDILKMDIEWAEWSIIQAFATTFSSSNLPFGQLSIEFHLPKGNHVNVQTTIDTFKILEKMHLRPFKMEFNMGGMIRDGVPRYCEYSFINIKVDNCLLHSARMG